MGGRVGVEVGVGVGELFCKGVSDGDGSGEVDVDQVVAVLRDAQFAKVACAGTGPVPMDQIVTETASQLSRSIFKW